MKRKIQLEDLFKFELADDVQIAPDGERIAYVSTKLNREDNSYETSIFMQEAGAEPERFTMGPGDAHPRFSPDGKTIAFLRRTADSRQVWLIGLAGGEARQLTELPGSVSQFAWSPDGKRLAIIGQFEKGALRSDGGSNDGAGGRGAPDLNGLADEDGARLFEKYTAGVQVIDELFHKMDGVGYYGAARPSLCVLSVDEPTDAVQLTEPPYSVGAPVWSHDGETVFIQGRLDPETYDRGGSELQIWAVPVDGSAVRQVTPAGLSCRTMALSPDGSTVAVVANKTDDMSYGNAGIFLVSLDEGDVRQIAAASDRPFDNKTVMGMGGRGDAVLEWAPDGKSLYSMTSREGTTQLAHVDVATEDVRLLTEGDRVIMSVSFSADRAAAAMVIADVGSPGKVYRFDVESGREECWLEPNAELLDELLLITPERFQSRAEDGPAVDGWIMKPHDMEPGKQYPAILSIHGGPALMYTSTFFFEKQLLAAEGYGIIYSNPRGSHGYGEEFCMAIQREWGGADYADLMATVDQALQDNDWIDPDRLGVTGGSYGGFMTNWIVGQTDRFKAAVTGRSIADHRATTGTGDLGPFRFKRNEDVPFWKDRDWYDDQSPIMYVENVTTPILIEHQEDDLRCPIEQAQIWYSAIKYLDKAPVRLVVYPKESHGMSRTGKPWHRIHRLREMLNWFHTYLHEV